MNKHKAKRIMQIEDWTKAAHKPVVRYFRDKKIIKKELRIYGGTARSTNSTGGSQIEKYQSRLS